MTLRRENRNAITALSLPGQARQGES